MQNERDVDFTPSPELDTTTHAAGRGAQSGDSLDRAKEKVQSLAGDARDKTTAQLQSRLDTQRNRASESLSTVANSLRSSSQQLQGQEDGISRYVAKAADQVENFANYLRDRDIEELIDEVEDFARRRPPVFLGGAFVLGMLGARFLKSSRRNLERNELREDWSTDELTRRVDDPERDAIGRPGAPGYASAPERGGAMY